MKSIGTTGRDGDLPTPLVMLEILRGRARNLRRSVRPPVFLIGRANDCDLVLGDPLFPDLHTYLFVTESAVTARYLGQGPPLQVDGVDQEATELIDGSLLKLGTYEFRIHVRQLDPRRFRTHTGSHSDRDASPGIARPKTGQDRSSFVHARAEIAGAPNPLAPNPLAPSANAPIVSAAPRLRIFDGSQRRSA